MADMDTMKETYLASLEAAERELAGMDERRAALKTAIEGLKRLLSDQQPLGPSLGPEERVNGKRPSIPKDFFKGKSPTQAYRDFKKLWPGEYSVPQIRDAFLEGGMTGKTKSELLNSIHSVLRRERLKEERRVARAGANGSGSPASDGYEE